MIRTIRPLFFSAALAISGGTAMSSASFAQETDQPNAGNVDLFETAPMFSDDLAQADEQTQTEATDNAQEPNTDDAVGDQGKRQDERRGHRMHRHDGHRHGWRHRGRYMSSRWGHRGGDWGRHAFRGPRHFAHAGRRHDGERRETFRNMMRGNFGRLMVLRSELGVTDEQRDQIKEIFSTHREEFKTKQQAVFEQRRALHELVTSGADEATIRESAGALGNAIAEAAVARATVRREALGVLTDEQRQKIEETREANRKSREEFRNKRGTSE